MSRRKARRRPRRRGTSVPVQVRPGRDEFITLVLNGDGHYGTRIYVPGITRDMFDAVSRLAWAGQVDAPLVQRFCRAAAEAILRANGSDLSALTTWGPADDLALLDLFSLIPEQPADRWTEYDDLAVRALLEGGGCRGE